ncbi:unnamed protein product [Onchocerca ochengi]|uniref:Ovule protein n=1 Tax=Onchocerca ochengi TaxID=42157 RepID=A0A182EHH7_ONCOC|nr:unnamed protein product [Onchocerca ochengi]
MEDCSSWISNIDQAESSAYLSSANANKVVISQFIKAFKTFLDTAQLPSLPRRGTKSNQVPGQSELKLK